MKTLKKIAKWIGILGLIIVGFGGMFYIFYVAPALDKIKEERLVEIDNTFKIHEGGGGNSGVITSDSLVIVIDTKMGDAAEAFATNIKALAGDRPILVVNTHYHVDHSSGNHLYPGYTVLAGAGYTPEIWVQEGRKEDMPNRWLNNKLDVRMNDDTISIFTLNMRSHTVGDVFVYSHKHKILFAGDVILNQQVPSVSNGDPYGYQEAFDKLESMYVIQKIVPGHGPTGGIEILKNFSEYFTDMHSAALNPAEEDKLVSKYNDWTQVPMLMSSANVVDAFRQQISK
jgi:cyclase